MHAVLRHLEAVGFPYSPRAMGLDEQGREILSYIPGRPAFRPWPPMLRSDVGLHATGRMLRELSDALAGVRPFADFLQRGDVAELDRERRKLVELRRELLG